MEGMRSGWGRVGSGEPVRGGDFAAAQNMVENKRCRTKVDHMIKSGETIAPAPPRPSETGSPRPFR